jgi:nitrite reductase/ring-hydroxylating ferredoxin subunit
MEARHEVEGLSQLKLGEMTHGTSNGPEVPILNADVFHHAFFNRGGHLSAPLDMAVFESGVSKCPLHSAVFDSHAGASRGHPRLGGEGMDTSELPGGFLESMLSTMAILEQTACNPLTPVPLEHHDGRIRVWL